MPINRRFSGYSPSHDKNTGKTTPSKKSAKDPPQVPEGGNISLPREMTEEARRQLRARQLLGAVDMEHPATIDYGALPDPDLDIQDPRGNQGNSVDGPTVFPMIRGPQPRMHTRVLNGDPDLRTASGEESTDLIAAVTINDRMILAFDNQMSDTHTSLRGLRRAAENLVRDLGSQGNPEALNNAKEILDLISKVMEPWFMQLDDRLQKIVDVSTEAQQVGGTPNGVQ